MDEVCLKLARLLEGLVHMVDNTQGQVKHTCNCCGHYCWNAGIIRRRKIARDQLMAVYFIRHTELAACIGCSACADICPVDAVTMVDGLPEVDTDWCIGCGVCAVTCPADVISIRRQRKDVPPESFRDLYRRIELEKKADDYEIVFTPAELFFLNNRTQNSQRIDLQG